MNRQPTGRLNPLAELHELGEALLRMYDAEIAERCMLDVLSDDVPLRRAMAFANRTIASDFDLHTADCFLQIARGALTRAGYLA